MDKLRESINNLKDRIELDIRHIGLYSDFHNIKDSLLKEYHSYQYNENDELSLKTYYAWLQVFYNNRVDFINKNIVNNTNNNIYDNSTNEQIEKISELETNIEEALNYIKDNYHEIKSITDEYYKLKEYYETEYHNLLEISKRRFNHSLGLIEKPVVSRIFEKDHIRSSIPTLTLYQDIYTLRQVYIHKLEAFKIDTIKLFVDNDQKIRKIFIDAYNEITDNDVIEIIKEIEANYYRGITQSIENDFMFVGLDQIQEKMTESCTKIKEMTDAAINSKNYYNKIINMTLNTDIDTILDIYKYTETSNLYKEEFYYILYIIIENEKHMVHKYNIKPVIYPNLPDKLKQIIEKEFTNYLDTCKVEEQQILVEKLKKFGYLSVSDNRYSLFFDNLDYTIDIDADIKEKNYNIYNYGSYDRIVFFKDKVSERHFEIGYGTPGDDVKIIPLKVRDVNDLASSKYLYAKSNYNNYFIDKETGEVTSIPIDFSRDTLRHLLDLFVTIDWNPREELYVYTVYNSNLEFITKIGNISNHKIDHVNNRLALIFKDSSIVKIYDNNFKYIKSIDLASIIENGDLKMINDGVFTIINDQKIVYYDYLNNKVIDELPRNSCYGFNEGLYIYHDDLGYFGYKNINGEVVIEPQFYYAEIFLNGIAKVRNDLGEGIINRSCCFKTVKEIFNLILDNRNKYYKTLDDEHKPMLLELNWLYNYLEIGATYDSYIIRREDHYEVCESSVSCKNKNRGGKLIITEKYYVNLDTPIIDIDFNLNNKVKKII